MVEVIIIALTLVGGALFLGLLWLLEKVGVWNHLIASLRNLITQSSERNQLLPVASSSRLLPASTPALSPESSSAALLNDLSSEERRVQFSQLKARSFRRDFDIDKKDNANETLLQRAARTGNWKNYARFSLLGASEDAVGPQKSARAYVETARKRQVVGVLTNLLIDFHRALYVETAPGCLAYCLSIPHAEPYLVSRSGLENLYTYSEFQPLINLARLCSRGLHRLSRRPPFTQKGYDSDEDECNVLPEEKLTVNVQIHGSTFHYGHSQQEEKSRNKICLQGKEFDYDTQKAFLHQLVHFVCQEVFNNDGNPYEKSDLVAHREFDEICRILLIPRSPPLDIILREAFNLRLYPKPHAELIARVPEMILSYPNGLDRLQEEAPGLLDYYREVFLSAVSQHIRILEERVMAPWFAELYSQVGSADNPPPYHQAGP